MSKHKIAKSASIISLGTGLSRIFGYARDVVMAFFFGTGVGAEAFVVAFRIPNLLRQLVGEGAASAALVPVFSEYLAVRDENEFQRLTTALFSIFSVALIGISIVGIISAPVIVKLIAPGFLKEATLYKYALTVKMTRILFPYIFLVGMGAFLMGVLHSFSIFAPSAFAPVFLNIAIITSVLLLRDKFTEPSISLALGALAGGVLQVAIQIPPVIKKGVRFKFIFKTAEKGVKKIGRLLFPRAIGAAVYQLNVFIDTIFASFTNIVGAGAIVALYLGMRIFRLPMGVFGYPVAAAALPTMSSQAAKNETEEFKKTVSFSLTSAFLLTIPAMAGFMVLSRPIINLLFEWGVFESYSTNITATALFFYSFCLFAYAGVQVLANSFYAMQDTRTPVKIAFAALIINVIFNYILMWKLKVGGLALATSISTIFNFSALFYILDRKLGHLDRKKITSSTLKIAAASLIMGICCYFIFSRLTFSFIEARLFREIIHLLATIAFSILIYLGCVYMFGVDEMRSLVRWLRRKR